MKCDELKAFKVVSAYIEYEDGTHDSGFDFEAYDKDEVDEAIAELRAKLESVQASAYADSVDAGMRERSLRRALWLARANNAINSYDKWNLFANFESEDKRFDIDEYDETPGVTDFSALRTYAEWCKVWQNVARKCLKKAEEYK